MGLTQPKDFVSDLDFINVYGTDIHKLLEAYGRYVRDCTIIWAAENVTANIEYKGDQTICSIDITALLAGRESDDLRI